MSMPWLLMFRTTFSKKQWWKVRARTILPSQQLVVSLFGQRGNPSAFIVLKHTSQHRQQHAHHQHMHAWATCQAWSSITLDPRYHIQLTNRTLVLCCLPQVCCMYQVHKPTAA